MPSNFIGIPAQLPAGNVERLTDVDARFHSPTVKLADNLPGGVADNLPGGVYEVRRRIYALILRAAKRCGPVCVTCRRRPIAYRYRGGAVLKGP